ncbi:unnamed protein product, partial [Pylaiella littoralis]
HNGLIAKFAPSWMRLARPGELLLRQYSLQLARTLPLPSGGRLRRTPKVFRPFTRLGASRTTKKRATSLS